MNPPNRNPNSTHPGDTTKENAAAEAEERAGNPQVEFDAGDDRVEIVDLVSPPHSSPETEERDGNPNVESDAGDDGVEIIDLVTPPPSPETEERAGNPNVEFDAGADEVDIVDLLKTPPHVSLETIFENPNNWWPDGSDVDDNIEFIDAERERLSLAGSFPGYYPSDKSPVRELQEPRPCIPLEVLKDSHKIKKSSAAPLPHLRCHPQRPPQQHQPPVEETKSPNERSRSLMQSGGGNDTRKGALPPVGELGWKEISVYDINTPGWLPQNQEIDKEPEYNINTNTGWRPQNQASMQSGDKGKGVGINPGREKSDGGRGSLPPTDGGRVGVIGGQETDQEPEYNINPQWDDASLEAALVAAIQADLELSFTPTNPSDNEDEDGYRRTNN